MHKLMRTTRVEPTPAALQAVHSQDPGEKTRTHPSYFDVGRGHSSSALTAAPTEFIFILFYASELFKIY